MCDCDSETTPRDRAAIRFMAAMLSNSCGAGPPVATRYSMQEYATAAVTAADAVFCALDGVEGPA